MVNAYCTSLVGLSHSQDVPTSTCKQKLWIETSWEWDWSATILLGTFLCYSDVPFRKLLNGGRNHSMASRGMGCLAYI